MDFVLRIFSFQQTFINRLPHTQHDKAVRKNEIEHIIPVLKNLLFIWAGQMNFSYTYKEVYEKS